MPHRLHLIVGTAHGQARVRQGPCRTIIHALPQAGRWCRYEDVAIEGGDATASAARGERGPLGG